MTPKQSSKSARRKPLRLPFFLFLAFSLFALSVAAGNVNIEVTNFRFQDSATVSERYYAVDVKVSSTGTKETGIIELGLSNSANIPFLAFFRSEAPCEATFPWNTHAYYAVGTISSYESVKFTLIGRGIPDGTYYPVITHASACFNALGQPKEPYGYGKRITANSIVFGQSGGNVNDQCDNPYTALQWIQAKGDLACKEATCDNAASTSSTAKCIRRGVCADGVEQWNTCSDGSSYAVRTCVNGNWVVNYGNCPDPPPPPSPRCDTVPPPKNCLVPPPKEAGLGGILLIGGAVLVVGYFLLVLARKSGLVKM